MNITILDAKSVIITDKSGKKVSLQYVGKLTLCSDKLAFDKNTARAKTYYTCRVCDKNFTSREYLRKHIVSKDHFVGARKKSLFYERNRSPSPQSRPISKSPSPERPASSSPSLRSLSPLSPPLRGDEFTARMYNLHARTTRKDIYDLLNYNNITIEFIEGTITNKAFITGDKETIARITLDLDGCVLDGNKIQVCNNLS